MRRLALLAIPLLAVSCQRLLPEPPLDPDKAWTFTFYRPQTGDKRVVSRVGVTEGDWRVSLGGESESDRGVSKWKETYTEELLAVPDGGDRPTRLRRVYDTIERTDPKGNRQPTRLLGKTVEVDLSGAKPAFTVNGKPPTADEEKELSREFAGKPKSHLTIDDMMPKQPVKAGDTWELDKTAVFAKLPLGKELVFDADKSKFTGRLVKVARKDGVAWATVEFVLKVGIADLCPPGAGVIRADAGSEVYITRTIEFAAEGNAPGVKSEEVTRAKVSGRLPNRVNVVFEFYQKDAVTETPQKK